MTTNELQKEFALIFPFWDKLSEDDRTLLCHHSVQSNFNHGTNIHGGNDKCTGAIVVKNGCVRVYMLSEEGREITLYRLYKGDICMLSASCVMKSITFDVIVDADTDCECIIISGKMFSEVAERNVYVKNFALETAVSRFSDVMWVMQQILFMSFDKRLAIFLTDELAKSGSDIIKLSYEQIAKYMGSAREVVSRMMKYFTSEGIAEKTRDGIHILDKAKLRSLTI